MLLPDQGSSASPTFLPSSLCTPTGPYPGCPRPVMPPVAPRVCFAQDHAGTVQCQSQRREHGRWAPHTPGFARTSSTLEPALPRGTAGGRLPPSSSRSRPAMRFPSPLARCGHATSSAPRTKFSLRSAPRVGTGVPVRTEQAGRSRRLSPSAAPGALPLRRTRSGCADKAGGGGQSLLALHLAPAPRAGRSPRPGRLLLAAFPGARRGRAAAAGRGQPPSARPGLPEPEGGRRGSLGPRGGSGGGGSPRPGRRPSLPRCPAQGPARRLLLRLRLLPVPAPMPLGGGRAAALPRGGCEAPAGLGQPRLPRPAAVYGRAAGLPVSAPPRPGPPPPPWPGGGRGSEAGPGAARSPPGGGRAREEPSGCGFPLLPLAPARRKPPRRAGKPHPEPRAHLGPRWRC